MTESKGVGMRGLLARYHAQQGQGDLVERTLGRMAEAVRLDEPACLVYRASRSADDPDVFVLYEEYEDEAALLAHRETPHFRDLIEGVIVPALVSRDRELLVPLLGPPGGERG
jgi:autoinducer 2-degrading protein